VQRELALVRVHASAENAPSCSASSTSPLQGRRRQPRSYTLEVTGDQDKIEALLEILQPLGIKEVVRTGGRPSPAPATAALRRPGRDALPDRRRGWPFILPGFALAGLFACSNAGGGRRRARPRPVRDLVFRDPARSIPRPRDAGLPADGRVIELLRGRRRHPDQHLPVHLQRARQPYACRRRGGRSQPPPGRFLAAWKPEASSDNAQASVTVRTPRRRRPFRADHRPHRAAHRLPSLAGSARGRGDRYGLIRFGSRSTCTSPRGRAVRARRRPLCARADVIARWRLAT